MIKKVRFIGGFNGAVTINKVYDVITHNENNNTIEIINDNKESWVYFIGFYDDNFFINVTAEIRNKVINSILG